MEMTLTWKCFLNVRLMDAKIRLFFKRSFFERQISGNEIGNELIKGNGNFKY